MRANEQVPTRFFLLSLALNEVCSFDEEEKNR